MTESTARSGPLAARANPRVDLAVLCAHFADLLRAAGVAIPVERVAWWAQATVAADPAFTGELYWLARVTLVDRP